jgi:MFS family permease
MSTYLSAFNTLYLRSFDISFSIIGIVAAIAMFPFILKVFIGLLSDRVSLFKKGHRKPYIIIGLIMQSIGFMLLPLFKPNANISLYIMMMVFIALGMSTYDTTTDGFSIDSSPAEDRGLVQALMVGGRALAMVITGVLMSVFSGAGNWNGIFYMVGILGIIALVFAFLIEESTEHTPETKFDSAAFKSFADKAFLLFVLMGFVYPLALYSAEGMVSAFANEILGVSLSTVGYLTAIYGLGTVCGGLVGAPLLKKFGPQNSLIGAMCLTALVTFLLAVTPVSGFLWVIMFLYGIAYGYYSTVYFALGMEFSDPRIAAFMFSVIMAVGNLAISAGSALAGGMVDAVGFRWMFVVFAVINLLVFPIIIAVFKNRGKAVAPAASAGD